MPAILIIDDDAVVRSSLTFLLKRAGYQPSAVKGPKEAILAIRESRPDLVLMDMNFSLTTTGEEGILLLRQVKLLWPTLPVILMTAWGSIALVLLNTIKNALDLSGTNDEDRSMTDGPRNDGFGKIIGQSVALSQVLDTVIRIAPTTASVLITGESGTGKELVAEAIHERSKRSAEAFVKVNLGGLSSTLFESEMFGHKKGAFTDAYADRVGRFEMANKGTIFLDEIGELELSSQVKLLRVLQDQTFEVLGDSRPRKVDIRVVSATNRDLAEMVKEHAFREDLFYRINLISIQLPALRERVDDIPLLVRHFADRLAETNGLPRVEFSGEAMSFLCGLPFPGNIRELKNLVERTLLVSGKNRIEASDFENYGMAITQRSVGNNPLTLEELERQTISRALERHGGNLSKTAQELGISRAALYRRLDKYGIAYDINRRDV